jgi:hypothetical protein
MQRPSNVCAMVSAEWVRDQAKSALTVIPAFPHPSLRGGKGRIAPLTDYCNLVLMRFDINNRYFNICYIIIIFFKQKFS